MMFVLYPPCILRIVQYLLTRVIGRPTCEIWGLVTYNTTANRCLPVRKNLNYVLVFPTQILPLCKYRLHIFSCIVINTLLLFLPITDFPFIVMIVRVCSVVVTAVMG